MTVRREWRWSLMCAAALAAACGAPESQSGPEFGNAAATAVTVTAASPSSATQDTTLDVQIAGTGFDRGSSAQFLVAGAADPRVRTNSSRYVSGTSMVANITIAVDALVSSYDVAVTTGSGKKGVGTELFIVKAKGSAAVVISGVTPAVVPSDTTLTLAVAGSGFDAGSTVALTVNGVVNPDVTINATTFVRSSLMNVTVTVAATAAANVYDLAVTSSTGVQAVGARLFTVMPLRVLPAIGNADAFGMNQYEIAVGHRLGGCDSELPVVWQADGSSQTLPLLPGTCSGEALSVNSSGVVAGYSGASWRPSPPALWTPGGSSYSVQSLAWGADWPLISNVNDAGHVAGYLATTTPRRYGWWNGVQWTGLIPPVNGSDCGVYGIGEADEIVGACHLNGGTFTAVYWSSPTAQGVFLPTMSGYAAFYAVNINRNHVIAGYVVGAVKRGAGPHLPARWVENGGGWTLELLGDLGGGFGQAAAVDDNGWITGFSKLANGTAHAFLWKPGSGMQDLGSLGSESWGYGIKTLATGGVRVVGSVNVGGTHRPVLWRP